MLKCLKDEVWRPVCMCIFESYVRATGLLQRWLPVERRVYEIGKDNIKRDITLRYYLALLLHSWLFRRQGDFLIEFRTTSGRRLVSNDSIIGVVQMVRKVPTKDFKLRVPFISYTVIINGVPLGYEAKRELLSHDRDDDFGLVYRLQTGEEVRLVEVELKGNKKVWCGADCKGLTVGDVLRLNI